MLKLSNTIRQINDKILKHWYKYTKTNLFKCFQIKFKLQHYACQHI